MALFTPTAVIATLVSDTNLVLVTETRLRLTAPASPATQKDLQAGAINRKVCHSILTQPTGSFQDLWLVGRLNLKKLDGSVPSFTTLRLTPIVQSTWVIGGVAGSSAGDAPVPLTTYSNVSLGEVYMVVRKPFAAPGVPSFYQRPQGQGDTISMNMSFNVQYKLTGTTTFKTLVAPAELSTLEMMGPIPELPAPYVIQERHSEESFSFEGTDLILTTSQLNESWLAAGNPIQWSEDLTNWETVPYTSFTRDLSNFSWKIRVSRLQPGGGLKPKIYFRFQW